MNSSPAEHAGNLSQTLDKLTHLERRGWWSWATALVIILSLTAGIVVLSRTPNRGSLAGSAEFELAVRALIPIVLLFAIFAMRQQQNIAKLRRELAIQIGMMATLEALKAPGAADLSQRQNRRKAQRFFFDQRVRLKVDGQMISGRIRDISEDGIGVILPQTLPAGCRASVEFIAKEGDATTVNSDVALRHSRGFYHGFEFLNVSGAHRDGIKAVLEGLIPTEL